MQIKKKKAMTRTGTAHLLTFNLLTCNLRYLYELINLNISLFLDLYGGGDAQIYECNDIVLCCMYV